MAEQPTVHVVEWSNDHDADVGVLADVSGFRPEPGLKHDDLRLTPVGRFLVASGHAKARRRYQDWAAAIMVQDIADTVRRLPVTAPSSMPRSATDRQADSVSPVSQAARSTNTSNAGEPCQPKLGMASRGANGVD